MAKPRNRRKSRAPCGATLPYAQRRLAWSSPGFANAEAVMMKLWEDENRPRRGINCDVTAIESILFADDELLIHGGDHGRHWNQRRWPHPVITERDLHVVAVTIQWLATNQGQHFFVKFQEHLARARKAARQAIMPKRRRTG